MRTHLIVWQRCLPELTCQNPGFMGRGNLTRRLVRNRDLMKHKMHPRKLVQGSPRQKSEEMDQFFNVSMELLCIANTDGYFLRLNPVWERTLGYSKEELMAQRFLDFVHPDDLLRTQEFVSIQVSQHRVINFENATVAKTARIGG